MVKDNWSHNVSVKLTELEKTLPVTVRAVLECLAPSGSEDKWQEGEPPTRTGRAALKRKWILASGESDQSLSRPIWYVWNQLGDLSKDPSHYKITLWRTHRWQFFRTTVLELLRIWNYKSFRVCFMGQYFSLKLTNIVCVALWCEISPSVNAISIEM